MNLLTEINRPSARRSGISVVEVLSAMVVALIGVFGVMILIPFSVQQAQNGLDRDEAVTVGRNAYEQFEIEGFRYVESRLNPLNNTRVLMSRIANPNPVHPSLPGVVVGPNPGVAVIDPLSRTVNGAPQFCGFDTFNLLDTNRAVFTEAMARKMCQTSDDLQFQSADDDLGAPQQIFDRANGQPARRQSLGRLSWNAVLVPVKVDYSPASQSSQQTPGMTFRMHVLVHKNRDLDRNGGTIDYPQLNVQWPITGTAFGGGTVRLNGRLNDVRRDDWVMLRNESQTLENGYRNQVGFYRVTAVGEAPNGNSILTLEGPDFAFNNNTQLHHLVVSRDGRRSGQVISVYERTMQWEQKSNWN